MSIHDVILPATAAPAAAAALARRALLAAAVRRPGRRRLVIMSPRALAGLGDTVPVPGTAPTYQQVIQQQVIAGQSSEYSGGAGQGISADDSANRNRQILGGIEPVDNGWWPLGNDSSLLGAYPDTSDPRLPRLREISACLKYAFRTGGPYGTAAAASGAGSIIGPQCGMVRDAYGIWRANVDIGRTAPGIGPGEPAYPDYFAPAIQQPTVTTAAPPAPTVPAASSPTSPAAPSPYYYYNQEGASPTGTWLPVGSTTPGSSTITTQLQAPTGSILPKAAADALPDVITNMPLWQTALAAAAIFYVYQQRKGKR